MMELKVWDRSQGRPGTRGRTCHEGAETAETWMCRFACRFAPFVNQVMTGLMIG